MDFEYDPQKSASNLEKHGLDFEKAKDVWRDQRSIEIDTKFDGEKRILVVGAIEGVLWTVVITQRDDRIRIISARRARDKEISSYDNG